MARRILFVLLLLVAAGAGAFGMSVYKDGQDDDDDREAASGTTTSTVFDFSTTTAPTTTAVDAAVTTTTAAGATTTTAAGATTTTAPGATTTTTTRRAACGTGTAVATFAGRDLTTTATGSTFRPTATVENKVNQPIEVAELEYEIVYPDGNRSVTFPTSGTTIAPGAISTFTVEPVTTATQYQTARLVRFAYFTAGRPPAECRVSI